MSELMEAVNKLLGRISAQGVIAAKTMGADVEITPEVVNLATEGAAITELASGEPWRSGVRVTAGSVLEYNGTSYECTKDHITQDNWNPERALGHMWDIHTTEAGTRENPIPFVLGMAVHKGLYYSYNGKTWTWEVADMASCSWNPGTAGVWQWKEA